MCSTFALKSAPHLADDVSMKYAKRLTDPKTVHIRLEAGIHEALERYAKQQGKAVAGLLTDTVTEWVIDLVSTNKVKDENVQDYDH